MIKQNTEEYIIKIEALLEEVGVKISEKKTYMEGEVPYRFIIGESPYLNKSNIVIPPKGSAYYKEHIPEVALLSVNYTIDMFAILNILLDSPIKADKLLELLTMTSNVYNFAEYLFIQRKILFINRYGRNGKNYSNRNALIARLFKKYNPSKILVIGARKTKSFESLTAMRSLSLIHSSPQALAANAKLWCKTYFCKNTNSNNNICLNDFII